MWFKINIFILLIFTFNSVYCRKSVCTRESAIGSIKRPSYDFAVRLLERVAQEEQDHFVFSPLSTWIQLTTLAEGAKEDTLKEISKITRHNRLLCNRRRLKEVLSEMNEEFKLNAATTSVVIIDKLYNVKDKFKKEAERGDIIKVLLLDFDKQLESAVTANEVISLGTNGVINEAIVPDDFNETTLLMIDSAVFKTTWKYPFSPANTAKEMFYDESDEPIGQVNMMNQFGYFNITTIPLIKSKVLELPCETDRVSMLFFLPTDGNTISDLFYSLKDIRLATIFNEFKRADQKLVQVQLPRVKITTELINLPELIHDMGITSIFYPEQANLSGISDFKIYASLISQLAEVEITEKGVTTLIAEFMIRGSDLEEFIANKPFGFMLVDKMMQIILYTGVYSKPSLF